MYNTPAASDSISLSLPVNAAYVSAARLTASSIANRMGFDIDEIEDIKAGVSETCTYIIKMLPADSQSNFQIQFNMRQDVLDIHIQARGVLLDSEDGGMSLIMIKALTDDLRVDAQENEISIYLEKRHKVTLFE